MAEVPEEAIHEAEEESAPAVHDHEGVSGEDGTLRLHLQHVHGLDVPLTMSPATQAGLHDRVHGQAGAADG
ncbi:MAG: hypothetical protein M3N31_06235 [Actinomycetota bacterium]|nr:hypothetical protein [Actinomycetota bacterium]